MCIYAFFEPFSTLSWRLQARAKKNVPLFEFPTLAAAWLTDQPTHSQSAKTENLLTYFTQLTELFLLDPVRFLEF